MAKPKVKIEWSDDGFRDLLSQGGVADLVDSETEAIATAAGEGFQAVTAQGGYGGGRRVGWVFATWHSARRAEAKAKTLTKAITNH